MSTEEKIKELLQKKTALNFRQAQLFQNLVQLERLHSKPGLSSNLFKDNQQKLTKIRQFYKILYWTMTFQLSERLNRRKIAQLISSSKLFDTGYYLQKNPEIEASGVDPLGHYIDVGANLGAEPNPLFDTAYYLQNSPEAVTSGMNPLVHYLAIGKSQGKNPHPLFDTAYYLQNSPEAVTSGMNPLGHYLTIGASQGRNPHPLFDTVYYLQNNPEAVTSGMNPLGHYLTIGASQGRNPHPLFDTAYYLQNNPEAVTSGMNPLVHYLSIGASQGKNPHPFFDAAYYSRNNSDAVALGINPLIHFVTGSYEKNGCPLLFADNLPLVASDLTSILIRTELLLPLLEEAKKISFSQYEHPEVSIIIPVYNKLEYTLRCLKSLMCQVSKSLTFEVIVVDDCSTDNTQEALPLVKGLKYIISQENSGFLQSCNRASQDASGKYIVILNNDTIVLENWLEELIHPFLIHEKVGLVGSMLLYPEGTLQEAGGLIWNDGSGWNFGRGQDPNRCEYNYIRETDYCSGASIALPTRLWQQLEGFDPLFSPAYYEDTDLAFRVRQSGYKVIYTPFSKVIHFEGISSGTDLNSGIKHYQLVNQPKFLERWQYYLVNFPTPPESTKDVNYQRNTRHKLLWVDAITPTPDQDSGSGDVFNFFKVIRKESWDVTFVPDNFCCYDGNYTKSLQRMGVECIYSPYWQSIEDYLKQYAAKFEVIVLSRVNVANKYVSLLRRYAPQAKLIFNTVDLHFLRQTRKSAILGQQDLINQAAQTFQDEILTIIRSDLTIVISQNEAQLIKHLVPMANLNVIPIIREIPSCKAKFEERKDIGFIGGFKHPPNVDAVLFFVSSIFPIITKRIPDCHFFIAGSHIPDSIAALASERIIIKGYVPELKDFFDDICISVAPLRYGAGMKGKIVSSLSYGVPVIATSIATEGMGITSGEEAMVADEPEQFAQAIVDIYTSKEKWITLSDKGVAFAKTNFSIETVGARIKIMLEELISGSDVK